MKITELEDEPKTDTLEQSDQQPEKPESANPSDLETLLAGYTEPAKVENLSPYPGTPEQTSSNTTGEFWKGNPLYYQRGKKKGTLRPNGSAYRPAVNMTVNNTPAEIGGDIISGALFLTIINLLMPMAFSLINNMVSKKKIAYEDMQIDDKTLKQLNDLADKALRQIKIEANPVWILAITMLGLYGMQFMTVKMLNDVKPKINAK